MATKLVDGVRVEMTPEEIESLRPTLAEARSSARRRVDQERDRRIALGVTVEVGQALIPVQTRHEKDFRNINGLATKAVLLTMVADDAPMQFRDAADVVHTVPPAGMIALADQAAAHVQAHYAAAWAFKDAIAAAETVEAVAAIDVTQGWPE